MNVVGGGNEISKNNALALLSWASGSSINHYSTNENATKIERHDLIWDTAVAQVNRVFIIMPCHYHIVI